MIFAAERKLWKLFQDSAIPLIALMVGVLFAAWLIGWIRNRYRDREDHAANELGMLLHLKELRREGDLTDEEFRSIQSRITPPGDGSARGMPAETTETTAPKQD